MIRARFPRVRSPGRSPRANGGWMAIADAQSSARRRSAAAAAAAAARRAAVRSRDTDRHMSRGRDWWW